MAKRALIVAGVLALALATGYQGAVVGVPLPWILGPMLISALAALTGHGLPEPKAVRQWAQVVLGAAIGQSFTIAILVSLTWLIPWMVLFSLWSLAMSAIGSLLLARWARLDRHTALLANLPGGVAEMAFLGGKAEGASTAIALVQAMRLSSLVLILPFAMTLLLDEASSPLAVPLAGGELGLGTLIVLGVGFVLGWSIDRLGVRNAFIVGALAVSVATTVSTGLDVGIPDPLFIAGQVAIGLALGSRFERRDVARMPRLVAAGLAASLITSVLTIVSAILVALPLGIAVPVMVLAGAPGGVAEMVITAAALGLGIAHVVAFQTVRIFVVNLFAAPVATLWLRVTDALWPEAVVQGRAGDSKR